MHISKQAAAEIDAIRTEFPKCDKMVYSICTRTSETGAKFCRRANELRGKADTHKLHHSLRVRVTEERYNQVKAIIEADGRFPTVNAWLDWWVWVFIKSYNKKVPLPGLATEERQEVRAMDTASASENNTNF